MGAEHSKENCLKWEREGGYSINDLSADCQHHIRMNRIDEMSNKDWAAGLQNLAYNINWEVGQRNVQLAKSMPSTLLI